MAEYLGITYTLKTSREQKDGSVEVDVEFNRNTIYRHVTFRFNSAEQAQSEFHNRCQHKIDVFIEKRQRKQSMDEIGEALYKYFSNPVNISLSKVDALDWYTENIDISEAI